jgi:hypothetical protein
LFNKSYVESYADLYAKSYVRTSPYYEKVTINIGPLSYIKDANQNAQGNRSLKVKIISVRSKQ